MDTLKTFRIAIILSATLYVAYYFAPWAYHLLNEEQSSLASYNGTGAMFIFPEMLAWAIFIATMVGYLGLLLQRKAFRTFFLALTVFELVTSPIHGMSIISGIEVFMFDTSNFLRGAALAMAYFSSIRGSFY